MGTVDIAGFTPRQRLAVRYAEAMYGTHDVDDLFLVELLAEFSHAEFIELSIVIAQFLSMGQLVAMLRIPNPDIVAVDI